MQHHHIQPFCVTKLKAMNTSILQTLVSKSPASTILINPTKLSTTTTTTTTPQSQNLLKLSCYFGRSLRISPINSSSSNTSSDGNDAPQPVPPPITPPNPVEIRFRRRSRRQRQRSEEGERDNKQSLQASAAKVTKKWEDMSITEKAIELYVGEKGALFWLNKFAYASIFVMIGAWIMFRFVGPALNLYQLDSTPLPPSSIIKGS